MLNLLYSPSVPEAFHRIGPWAWPQSNQSAGPVRFLIFCSISIFLLASLVAGRRHQCNAGAVQQGMYSTIPIHWNIKSAPASPGRSRVGPAFYVFSFLGPDTCNKIQENRPKSSDAVIVYVYPLRSWADNICTSHCFTCWVLQCEENLFLLRFWFWTCSFFSYDQFDVQYL